MEYPPPTSPKYVECMPTTPGGGHIMIVPSTPEPTVYNNDNYEEHEIGGGANVFHGGGYAGGRGRPTTMPMHEVPNFAFEFGQDDDDDNEVMSPGIKYMLTSCSSSGQQNAQCMDARRRKSDIDPARRSVSPAGVERTRSASVNYSTAAAAGNNNYQQQAAAMTGQQRSSNLSLPVQQYRKHSSVSNHSAASDVSSSNLSPFFTPINQSPAMVSESGKGPHFEFDGPHLSSNEVQGGSSIQNCTSIEDER